MQELIINTKLEKRSKILIGESYKQLEKYLPKAKIVVIIDQNVFDLYKDFFCAFDCIKITTNENAKTLATVENIVSQLIKLQADRSTFIVGVGGGITCDIAGFAASMFMRGVKFGFVSTSLLSQVDASVGGKNGVNLEGYKNILGVFNQPEFVICDIDMLQTLPQSEYLCGLAESVKIALISDLLMFELLENNVDAVLNRDSDMMKQIILQSIKLKKNIVERDEREIGERRKLNFGHTFAHALERESNTPHGFAVSVGMTFAAKISKHFGLVKQNDVDRIELLLQKFNLPICMPANKNRLVENMFADKKKRGDEIDFILLKNIGESCERRLTFNEIKTLIYDLC